MKKLAEYIYEKPISIAVNGKNLRKIIKLSSKDGYTYSSVEIFRNIDTINIYTNEFYVGTFNLDEQINFLHFVNKIVLKYCNSTKHYTAEIHLNPPKW